MIYQDTSSFGKQIPIYVRYRVLEDSTKEVDVTKTFFAGGPVTIDTIANGQKLIPVAADGPVYGLAKFQKNTYLDEVTGTQPSGIYGSFRGTVIVRGIVDLYTTMVFTLSDGSTHTTTLVNVTNLALMNLGLYVDDAATADGNYPLCYSSETAWTKTFVGYALNYDAAAGIVQILLP
jgi:hypothetical protein